MVLKQFISQIKSGELLDCNRKVWIQVYFPILKKGFVISTIENKVITIDDGSEATMVDCSLHLKADQSWTCILGFYSN